MLGENVELIATHQNDREMTPYERLLGDALDGDQSLFAREDSVEAQRQTEDGVLSEGSSLP